MHEAWSNVHEPDRYGHTNAKHLGGVEGRIMPPKHQTRNFLLITIASHLTTGMSSLLRLRAASVNKY
jgi:hypothetical protein